jgi:hypothetical protein
MTYSRFIVLTVLRMRSVVLLAAVAFASFASVQLPAVTKAASRDKAAANGIYQCLPEPEGGCIRIRRRSACLAIPDANGRKATQATASAGGFIAGTDQQDALTRIVPSCSLRLL